MTTQEQVEILAVLTTRNEAGKHFMEVFDPDRLRKLEEEGLIAIHRPTHEATGLPYSAEYWSVEVTPDGQDLVDAWPEYWPEEVTPPEEE